MKPPNEPFNEHQEVKTNKILYFDTRGQKDVALPKTAEGTIVHVYNNGEAYEVEFPLVGSNKSEVLTIKHGDLYKGKDK